MRIKYSTRNIIASFFGQLFAISISFLNRRIFIQQLSIELLGVEGLFSNILRLLALAEIGFAIAINYNLYKPLAEKNEEKICGLLNYFRIVYQRIGIIVLVIGVALLPFLDYIIKTDVSIPNLQLYYVLFLLNSAVTYFISYKRSIFIADQKNYYVAIIHYTSFFISNLLQIVVLVLFQNFVFYLVINILFRVLENLIIYRYADKKYPYIRDLKKYKLQDNYRKSLQKDVYALAHHKIGSVVIGGVDSLIISSFIGLDIVGIYSNYYLIIHALQTILNQLFNSLIASVGNLSVSESEEKKISVFNSIMMANVWIFGFCSITFFILSKDFIKIWVGKEFIFDQNIVFLLALNLFLHGTRKPALIFKDAMGLFWYDRYKPLLEAALKVGFSILLVQYFSLAGVFLGSILSVVLSCLWIEPLVVFKFGFKTSIKEYFIRYMTYFLVTGVAFVLVYFTSMALSYSLILNLIIKGVLCLIIINLVYYISFYKLKEFDDLLILTNKALFTLKA
jgi:O-antigen/teichoic acid export membrane protein